MIKQMMSLADELLMKTADRKFKLGVLVFMTNTLVLVLGYIDQEVWKSVTNWTFVFFVTSNVGQKFIPKNGVGNGKSV